MKLRMLSLLSVVLVLTIKSMNISAKDYHELRVFANVIPDAPFVPFLQPEMNTELDSVIYQLAQANSIKERCVGYGDAVTEEFLAYERLKLIASEEELNELMLHESPIVKVYAYRALIVNDMNMNCDYELALLEDSTCIDWFSEDMLTNTTVQEMVQMAYFE
ncbi:MAG: hypothetical protein QNK23_05905 [Crocinitomicaceae bacterium]|nr:hypothetical protein [Crocinitomicaceae bacterium]